MKFHKFIWLILLCFLGNKIHAQTDTFVIRLLGPDTIRWLVNIPFNDPGALATRNQDTIPYNTSGTLDITHLGTYTITYEIKDHFNSVISVIRFIHVVDTIAPVIEVLGQNPLAIKFCDSYTELGIKVKDNYDPPIVVTQTDKSNFIKLWIDTTALRSTGYYGKVYYKAIDQSGNIDSASRFIYFLFDAGTTYPCVSGIESPNIQRTPISMYPNPSSGNFQFVIPNTENALTIKVYDLFGKRVYQQNEIVKYPNQPINMNLSHLNSGIYYVEVVGINSIYYAKLMLLK